MIGIRKRLFKNKTKEFTEEDLIEVHHIMMVVYGGWISPEEFAKIPMPTLWNLMPKINKEMQRKNQMYQAICRFCGVKKEDLIL